MDYCDMPDHLGRLNYCNACDLFPVDMGINIAPLHDQINKCKQRYHRDVWKILCDGVAGTALSRNDRRRVRHREFDQDGSTATDDKLIADDFLAELDAEISANPWEKAPGRRGSSGNKNETPDLSDKSKQPTSSNTSPNDEWTDRHPRSRNNRRDKCSVSIGGVGGGSRSCVGWAPIETQLYKLRSSLESAHRGSGSSSSNKRKMATKNSSAFTKSETPSTKSVTQSVTAVVSSSGSGSSQNRSKKQRPRTLKFTLIIDPAKQEVITASGKKSFKTVTVTTESSFAPLRCGEWAHPLLLKSPTGGSGTAATTASTQTATQRRRLRGSQASRKQVTAPV